MSDLVGNPEERSSGDAAHFSCVIKTDLWDADWI